MHVNNPVQFALSFSPLVEFAKKRTKEIQNTILNGAQTKFARHIKYLFSFIFSLISPSFSFIGFYSLKNFKNFCFDLSTMTFKFIYKRFASLNEIFGTNIMASNNCLIIYCSIRFLIALIGSRGGGDQYAHRSIC